MVDGQSLNWIKMQQHNKFEFSGLLLVVVVVFGGLLVVADAAPADRLQVEPNPIKALENPDLIEGDIVPRKHELPGEERNAVPSDFQLWPQGIIPFEFDEKIASNVGVKNLIEDVMDYYHERTCIRFRKYDPSTDPDYIRIVAGDGCSSSVGRIGGRQEVSLGLGCGYRGTITHELLHAIGFMHEHMRSDRDEFLDIHWDNINPKYQDQFLALQPNQNRLLTSFDYESVMLYGERAFSKDGFAKTMTPKQLGVIMREVHEKPGLSRMDAMRVNILYRCL